HTLPARSSARHAWWCRSRLFLQSLHPTSELSPFVLRHDLVESRKQLILLLGCMMLDVLLERGHSLLEGVLEGVDVTMLLADARHLVLHTRMLLQRLVDLLHQLAVAESPDRRVKDLLLDQRMNLELIAHLLYDPQALGPGDVAHGSAE